MIKAIFMENFVLTESSGDVKTFYDKSRFGSLLKNGQLKLGLIEALYLHETEKIEVTNGKKPYTFEQLLKKVKKFEKSILVRYAVYKDLRDRGYIVKTALKFGADFRVYDKGIKPGEDHARWVVFPVSEGEVNTWQDFSAKNRVAHSTRKLLMLGVVDDEGDVTYYEVKWLRP